MSCTYAEGLSPYPNKGKLGMPERIASKEEVTETVKELAKYMRESKHTVFHTGAGISTSAGIPDFRGPKGVWTLEKKGLKPDISVSFDDAKPTFTHMALVTLEEAGYIQYLVTQNIDGLHLRSGFPRRKMAELHGNMYLDKCSVCKREFVRHTAATTVGQKSSGVGCLGKRSTGRRCRGILHDNILDWEHGLPHLDYNLAEKHSIASDLSVCLGTTLQIIPSGVLPTLNKQSGGKLVICNLQPTKHDKIADVIINFYVDDVMRELLSVLGLKCQEYRADTDPVLATKAIFTQQCSGEDPIEWTISDDWFEETDLVAKVKAKKAIINENKKESNKRSRNKEKGKIKDEEEEIVVKQSVNMEKMEREARRKRRSNLQDDESDVKVAKLDDKIKHENGKNSEVENDDEVDSKIDKQNSGSADDISSSAIDNKTEVLEDPKNVASDERIKDSVRKIEPMELGDTDKTCPNTSEKVATLLDESIKDYEGKSNNCEGLDSQKSPKDSTNKQDPLTAAIIHSSEESKAGSRSSESIPESKNEPEIDAVCNSNSAAASKGNGQSEILNRSLNEGALEKSRCVSEKATHSALENSNDSSPDASPNVQSNSLKSPSTLQNSIPSIEAALKDTAPLNNHSDTIDSKVSLSNNSSPNSSSKDISQVGSADVTLKPESSTTLSSLQPLDESSSQ